MKTSLADIREDDEIEEAVEALLDSLGIPKEADFEFCPTGEGGGIDPTCSPGENQGAQPAGSKPGDDLETEPTLFPLPAPDLVASAKPVTEEEVTQAINFDEWASGISSEERSAVYAYTNGAYGAMNEYLRHGELDSAREHYGISEDSLRSETEDHVRNSMDIESVLTDAGISEDASTDEKSDVIEAWVEQEVDRLVKAELEERLAGADGELTQQISDLDDALDDSYVKQSMILYRKVGSQAFPSDIEPGDVYQDKGFISTSIDKNHWAGAWRFDIAVPAGANAAWVDPISDNKGEKEVILPRGSKFAVRSVDASSRIIGMVLMS